MCVQVCPTGIDIRKGLQAACISCGVCIDACNSIMDKIKAPRGLIRFSPLNPDSPTRGAPWRKPRLWVYGGVITAVVTLMMPLSYSIAHGIELGFVSYTAIKVLSGRTKDVSVSVWVLSVLFLAHIVLGG